MPFQLLNSNLEWEIQNSCYLCNAFGAHALLAKLTMVTSSEKKAEFGLCTKEANVSLNNFAFEIRRQTFKFCAGKRTSNVSQFRM